MAATAPKRRRGARNASAIVWRCLQSMSLGKPVRVVLMHGAGTHDGRVVRWERDARREPRTPKSRSSPIIFVFADGYEVAVNSIERVLGPREDDES